MKLICCSFMCVVAVCASPGLRLSHGQSAQATEIGMAVEFMDHAAAAYVARDKGWFKEAGLRLSSYESYVTGMALAAALARGDIQVAYLCLVPAINVRANAGVKIKVVAGTHKHGYGLVVDPAKVRSPQDLEKPDTRVGCIQVGGASDVLLHKTIEKYRLDKNKILPKVQRMNPPKQLLAIRAKKLDAAFLPEQWATMAEEYAFRMLLTAKDVWPGMEGSVLAVKEDLIRNHPDLVGTLVNVTQKATRWINEHPREASAVVARQLSFAENPLFPAAAAGSARKLQLTPSVLFKSMSRLDYDTNITEQDAQEVIDYVAGLGYIKQGFPAQEILDLRFLNP